MIHPINSAQQIAALIRSELNNRAASAPSAARNRQVEFAGVVAGASMHEPLGAIIARRLRSLNRDDPNAPQHAFRVFLESVLLAHFGEELINDPAFFRLVDDVQRTMTADPELSNAITTASAQLLIE